MIMSPFFLLGIIYRHFETSILIPNSWKFIGGCVVCYIGLMGLDSCFFDSHIVVATNSYKNLPLIFIYAFVGILSLLLLDSSLEFVGMVSKKKYSHTEKEVNLILERNRLNNK